MQQGFKTLDEVEREQILLALEVFKNNKTQASRALGITIKTLYNRLHKYGLFDQYRTYGADAASVVSEATGLPEGA